VSVTYIPTGASSGSCVVFSIGTATSYATPERRARLDEDAPDTAFWRSVAEAGDDVMFKERNRVDAPR
jgi:hypothetical protein